MPLCKTMSGGHEAHKSDKGLPAHSSEMEIKSLTRNDSFRVLYFQIIFVTAHLFSFNRYQVRLL